MTGIPEEKPKNRLAELIYKDGKLQPGKRQMVILCAVLVAVAVLIGFGIRALISGSEEKNLDSNASTFTEGGMTFNRRDGQAVQKWDVVIFRRDNALDGYLIKRVIAVAGETVDIDDNGAVYVNGEKYLTDKAYYKKDISLPLTVPEGELFVLGDNGDESADSRRSYVGNVRVDEVEGVAASE